MLILIFIIAVIILCTLIGTIPTMRLRRPLSFLDRGGKEIFMTVIFLGIGALVIYLIVWSIFLR